MKKLTVFTIILACALVASLALNVVLLASRPLDSTDPAIGTPETKMMEIPTPYGALQFPEKYRDVLKHHGEQKDGIYTHTFSMLHGDEAVELFTLYFGDISDGTQIGSVLVDGVQLPITVISTSRDSEGLWTEEEIDLFGGMQMVINDVIPSQAPWQNAID